MTTRSGSSKEFQVIRNDPDSVRLELRFASTGVSLGDFREAVSDVGRVIVESHLTELLEVARVAGMSPSETSQLLMDTAEAQAKVWLEAPRRGSFVVGLVIAGWTTVAAPLALKFLGGAAEEAGKVVGRKVTAILLKLRRDRPDRLRTQLKKGLRGRRFKVRVEGAKTPKISPRKKMPTKVRVPRS